MTKGVFITVDGRVTVGEDGGRRERVGDGLVDGKSGVVHAGPAGAVTSDGSFSPANRALVDAPPAPRSAVECRRDNHIGPWREGAASKPALPGVLTSANADQRQLARWGGGPTRPREVSGAPTAPRPAPTAESERGSATDPSDDVSKVRPPGGLSVRDVSWAPTGLQLTRQGVAGGPRAAYTASPLSNFKDPMVLVALLGLLSIRRPRLALQAVGLSHREQGQGGADGARHQRGAAGIEFEGGDLLRRRLWMELHRLSC